MSKFFTKNHLLLSSNQDVIKVNKQNLYHKVFLWGNDTCIILFIIDCMHVGTSIKILIEVSWRCDYFCQSMSDLIDLSLIKLNTRVFKIRKINKFIIQQHIINFLIPSTPLLK